MVKALQGPTPINLRRGIAPTYLPIHIKSLPSEELRIARARIEERLEAAKMEERAAEGRRRVIQWELETLQRHCPHANVETDGEPWQGGGLYFTRSHCHDCGKSGDRYSRALTIEKSRAWAKKWGHDKGEEFYETNTPHKANLFMTDDVNW
jgi:hypothetical protein